jgi:hypothetical protein
LSPDKTETKIREASLLNQLGGLSTALGGTGPVSNLLSSLGLQGGLANLGKAVLGGNYTNAANNTGSLFYDTGTGTAGDQEGDFNMYDPYSWGTSPSDSAMAQDPNFNWLDWYNGTGDYGNYGE